MHGRDQPGNVPCELNPPDVVPWPVEQCDPVWGILLTIYTYVYLYIHTYVYMIYVHILVWQAQAGGCGS